MSRSSKPRYESKLETSARVEARNFGTSRSSKPPRASTGERRRLKRPDGSCREPSRVSRAEAARAGRRAEMFTPIVPSRQAHGTSQRRRPSTHAAQSGRLTRPVQGAEPRSVIREYRQPAVSESVRIRIDWDPHSQGAGPRSVRIVARPSTSPCGPVCAAPPFADPAHTGPHRLGGDGIRRPW